MVLLSYELYLCQSFFFRSYSNVYGCWYLTGLLSHCPPFATQSINSSYYTRRIVYRVSSWFFRGIGYSSQRHYLYFIWGRYRSYCGFYTKSASWTGFFSGYWPWYSSIHRHSFEQKLRHHITSRWTTSHRGGVSSYGRYSYRWVYLFLRRKPKDGLPIIIYYPSSLSLGFSFA